MVAFQAYNQEQVRRLHAAAVTAAAARTGRRVSRCLWSGFLCRLSARPLAQTFFSPPDDPGRMTPDRVNVGYRSNQAVLAPMLILMVLAAWSFSLISCASQRLLAVHCRRGCTRMGLMQARRIACHPLRQPAAACHSVAHLRGNAADDDYREASRVAVSQPFSNGTKNRSASDHQSPAHYAAVMTATSLQPSCPSSEC